MQPHLILDVIQRVSDGQAPQPRPDVSVVMCELR